jgi:hypothetical protein
MYGQQPHQYDKTDSQISPTMFSKINSRRVLDLNVGEVRHVTANKLFVNVAGKVLSPDIVFTRIWRPSGNLCQSLPRACRRENECLSW